MWCSTVALHAVAFVKSSQLVSTRHDPEGSTYVQELSACMQLSIVALCAWQSNGVVVVVVVVDPSYKYVNALQ